MKRSLLMICVLAMLSLGAFAETGALAALNKPDTGRKIVANACVMSYTDALGKSIMVIRGNPLTVIIK